MFITGIGIPTSSAIIGPMFIVVWANSQNASTPKMIPKSSATFRMSPRPAPSIAGSTARFAK